MFNCCKQCTTEFIASLGYNFKRDFSTHKYTQELKSKSKIYVIIELFISILYLYIFI